MAASIFVTRREANASPLGVSAQSAGLDGPRAVRVRAFGKRSRSCRWRASFEFWKWATTRIDYRALRELPVADSCRTKLDRANGVNL